MKFGVLIIGDEILSGRREDKHLQKVIELLTARGLQLSWAEYAGDDPERITAILQRTLAGTDVVFSTGGIGATPDDHTRQCAAAAKGVPIVLHPEAERLIRERMDEIAQNADLVHLRRMNPAQTLKMGEFPKGAGIIPNPFNKIPGFSLAGKGEGGLAGAHYFVPGFPVMAWPMLEWVLDSYYSHLFHQEVWAERSFLVYKAPESVLTPLMEKIEADFAGIKVFSLPSVGDESRGERYARSHIDLGVKGHPDALPAAYAALLAGTRELGYEILEPQN